MSSPVATTTCTANTAVDCNGLTGYTCAGTDRPDQDPVYVDGIPQGTVCADDGPPAADGSQNYCCTSSAVPCAYNPIAICDPGTYGFQCRGSDRPEALNPALSCANGVRDRDFINYCCSGTAPAAACTDTCCKSDGACGARLDGWTCKGDYRPRAQNFGSNESRADYFYFVCGTPTPAPNPAYNIYCCYTPALVPIGGSCVSDIKVSESIPTCTSGRFGFACYGRDTPEDDYAPMHCPEPPVAGYSAEGYPATLYCCDVE